MSQSKTRGRPAIVSRLIDFVKSPFFIGLLLTVILIFLARTYYQVRNQNRIETSQFSTTTAIFRGVEALDFFLNDGRFLIRGEKKSEARVGLIDIDDRSIEEVGRWPWSREKLALVIDQAMKLGAKAVGLDMVFSEPQVDSRIASFQKIEAALTSVPPELKGILDKERANAQPDVELAGVVDRNKDRLVLGAFSEQSAQNDQAEPYTDYCRNEAFNRAGAGKFIKIENVSFVVIDNTDLFESVKFDQLFSVIFSDIEQKTMAKFLKDTGHQDASQLNEAEKRREQFQVSEANMGYCDRWLTTKDEYGPTDEKFFAGLTKTLPLFKDLSAEQAMRLFSQKVLLYPMPQSSAWTANIDELQAPAIFTSSFNAFQDDDGKIRNNPLFYRTGNRLGVSFVPSLALQTYLAARPGYQAQVEVDYDPQDNRQKKITAFTVVDTNKDNAPVLQIPVDGQGKLKINYAGGTHMYPYVPAQELLNDNPTMKILEKTWNPLAQRFVEEEKTVNKAEFMKDRSFIFGITAIGVYDLRVTPFEKNFPGPETHLNVLANLMDGNFLRVDPNESTKMTWALAALGIALAFAVAKTGALWGMIITLLAEVALIFLDQALLKRGITATMVLPALLIAGEYVLLTMYKYFTEERNKAHLRSTFAKYVSPAVVDEILRDPGNIELGGKKVRMSVFFSDVRGFTTISEKLDPQKLSEVLNMYLTPMTQLVFANRGTLDKYMGDAVMAFFGAPIHYLDHAKCACRCALQSIERLKLLQKEFKDQGLPEIDIGIGVNTSEMNVGNMGSDTVRSYTVMGDGVNLGSRLEGINKEYGTRIIISQFTHEDVKDSFTAREIDWVRVKGKNEPVRIFELISEGPPPPGWAECLKAFHSGFVLYHERNFGEAKTCFNLALASRPGDPVSELYVERCDDYLQDQPAADWDGVYVMKTK